MFFFSRRSLLVAVAVGDFLIGATLADARTGVGRGLPSLNIDRMCSDTGLDGNGAECRQDEADARSKLEARWSTIPSQYRTVCLASSLNTVAPSYVDLSICLQEYREINNESQSNQGSGSKPDTNIPDIEIGD